MSDELARFEELVSPLGRELLDELAAEDVDVTSPRVGERLRARYPTDLVVDALTQHGLRGRAAGTFSRAAAMFFTRDGLEQASGEDVARHRARRFEPFGTVADLCTGVGGDLVALAARGGVRAVDRDPLHLRMAEENARAYGVDDAVGTVPRDVRDVDLDGVDAAFVDPARRSATRRMRTGESAPPLAWCAGLAATVDAVGVKAAPALAHDDVPEGWELELVAVGRKLKEAVLWSPGLRTAARRATVLPGGDALTPVEGPPVRVDAPGAYLLDPSPAVTRAGLVTDLARTVGAWQVDERIAFLSADEPLTTPFARTLRVVDSAPWNEKRLPATLRALDVGAVDVRRRGLAGDVDRLHRKLKVTGSRRATVVMTRVADRPWGLVCVDPGPGAEG